MPAAAAGTAGSAAGAGCARCDRSTAGSAGAADANLIQNIHAHTVAALAAGTARAAVGTTGGAVTAASSGRCPTGIVPGETAGSAGSARPAVRSGLTSRTTHAAGGTPAKRVRFAAGPAGASGLGGAQRTGVALAPGDAGDGTRPS